MAKLKDLDERALVNNIKKVIRPAKNVDGTDDDAAILKNGCVVSTDTVTFERHKPKNMSFEHFGWLSAAVSFSDLAAMGAKPVGVVAALGMPEDMDDSDLYDVMSGIDQCAELCETFVIGGDTKPGHGSITTTAIGDMEGRKPMMRSGAQPGNIVAVTGSLGGPAAGLKAIENNMEAEEAIFSLTTPVPRVQEGIILSKTGKVTSCIDLSDGVATAANTICKMSHVGMDIYAEFLPEGPDVKEIAEDLNLDKNELMLEWGGEYELLFTFDKKDVDELNKCGVLFSIIGIVTNDDGVTLCEGDDRRKLGYGKY